MRALSVSRSAAGSAAGLSAPFPVSAPRRFRHTGPTSGSHDRGWYHRRFCSRVEVLAGISPCGRYRRRHVALAMRGGQPGSVPAVPALQIGPMGHPAPRTDGKVGATPPTIVAIYAGRTWTPHARVAHLPAIIAGLRWRVECRIGGDRKELPEHDPAGLDREGRPS